MNFNDFYFVLITISYGSGGVFPLCLLVYFSQRWQSGKSPTPSFFFFVCLNGICTCYQHFWVQLIEKVSNEYMHNALHWDSTNFVV